MKIQAVIFDWAGTTIDFGCCGPVGAVRLAFAQHGIDITEADARRPMGLLKRDHIAAVLGYANVAAAWTAAHGTAPNETALDRIYADFVTLQATALRQHADVIPGVLDSIAQLRQRDIQIGSTTGYTREMLAPVAAIAAEQGYTPDSSVTPDEAGSGRPHPFMILKNLIALQVWPLKSVVKVGDTPIDVQEGLNAGVWSIGIAGTGNGIGLTKAAFDELSESKREDLLAKSRSELKFAGAHFVIDTMAELNGVITQIETLQQR